MAPVNMKKNVRNVINERKLERKKWKEQKLLKAAVEVKKDLQEACHLSTGRDELTPEVVSNDHSAVGDIHDAMPSTNTPYTLSIAVPGSILDNAQSQELRTYLAGQIARAASIYCVDEVSR